jgi:hypothetical protein
MTKTGDIQKMHTTLEGSHAIYRLPIDNDLVAMNGLVGQKILWRKAIVQPPLWLTASAKVMVASFRLHNAQITTRQILTTRVTKPLRITFSSCSATV